MYCIKNQSIGVAYGALLNLFWIFEYATSEWFAGPADFTDVQKVAQQFSSICILNFNPKTSIEVLKYILQNMIFFLFWSISFRLMADWVIFHIGWVVDKACVYTMKGQW